ncbi:MAG: peptide chain release factor 2 [Pseudoclavibacter sp.]|jgi:peptide chain release factor 2
MADLDISEDLAKLRSTYSDIVQVLDLDSLRATVDDLNEQAAAPGLWDNPDAAQSVTSRLAHTKSRLATVEDLGQRLDDLEVLVELANSEDDQDTREEAVAELRALQRAIDDLEVQTLLNGEYDERDAVVTIRAGAGGVDAADFAQMLLRMYLRWAEKHGYQSKVLDTSYAEEAGIKSATFEIDAPYAFGTLSVEGGTHRLVRMSPFNSAGKRQTSFAAVEVVPLAEPTDHIDIPDSEIRIDVFHASGPGGQGVNTTDSAVRITHFPTGIVVSMQDERSQIQNKAAAMRILESKLLDLRHQEEEAKEKELRGDVKASWGDQMRSYVLAPYRMVKDLRTEYEENNPDDVFGGDIDGFISAGIRWRKTGQKQSA